VSRLTCRAVFGVGGLLAGFAQNKIWLYCARAVSGIGGGGINSLSMIIVSDVVPIRERGKYLTLLGVGIAAGSGGYLDSGDFQLAYLV
jgi:MFS family permease